MSLARLKLNNYMLAGIFHRVDTLPFAGPAPVGIKRKDRFKGVEAIFYQIIFFTILIPF